MSFEPAIPGQKLVLGLQDELQRFTWNLMAGRTGCVVALEPKTGEVLAMVSKPSYDAKIFLGQLSSGTYKQLSEDPETPLINRAISTATAPGSTFKIVHHFGGNAEGDFPSEQHFYVARADCRLATGLLHALVHTGVFHFAERCSRVATPILCPWHCKSGQPHSLKPLRSWALASERAWT